MSISKWLKGLFRKEETVELSSVTVEENVDTDVLPKEENSNENLESEGLLNFPEDERPLLKLILTLFKSSRFNEKETMDVFIGSSNILALDDSDTIKTTLITDTKDTSLNAIFDYANTLAIDSEGDYGYNTNLILGKNLIELFSEINSRKYTLMFSCDTKHKFAETISSGKANIIYLSVKGNLYNNRIKFFKYLKGELSEFPLNIELTRYSKTYLRGKFDLWYKNRYIVKVIEKLNKKSNGIYLLDSDLPRFFMPDITIGKNKLVDALNDDTRLFLSHKEKEIVTNLFYYLYNVDKCSHLLIDNGMSLTELMTTYPAVKEDVESGRRLVLVISDDSYHLYDPTTIKQFINL